MKHGSKKDADAQHQVLYVKFINSIFRRFDIEPIKDVHDFETGIPFILFLHHGCKAKLRKYNVKNSDKNKMVQKANHGVALKMYDEVLAKEKKKGRTGWPPRMIKEVNLEKTRDDRMLSPVLGALFMMIKVAGTYDMHGSGNLEELLLKWYRGQVDAYGQGGRPTNFASDLRNAEIWNALHHSCTDGNPGNWDRWAQKDGNEAENLDQTFQAFEKDMGVEQLFSGEDVMMGRTDKEAMVTYIVSIRMQQRQKMQQDYVRRAKALQVSCREEIERFGTEAGNSEQMAYDHINQLKRVEGNYQEVETKDLAFLFNEIKDDNPKWTCDDAILPSALMAAFMEYRQAKDVYWEKIASGLILTNEVPAAQQTEG